MHTILLPSSRRTRLMNASRYPNAAALLAHLPLLRRRVPLAVYWSRRRVDRFDLGREMVASAPFTRGFVMLPGVRRRMERAGGTALAGAQAAAGGLKARTAPNATPKREPRRRNSNRAFLAIASLSVGALVMYYLDPALGRRRRALVRDQFAHTKRVFTHDLPRRAEKRGRFFRGVARGVRHNAVSPLRNGHHADTDDETLVDRVRSEVLRGRGINAGEIHIEAYEGAVTLRGQLQHPEQIRRLIEATGEVEGVQRVRSYLHLPGTIAPNKAEIYDLEHAPYTSL